MSQLNAQLSRRDLIKRFGAAAVASTGLFGFSHQAWSKQSAHIVIVGGGIGGAATAKYLRIANKDVRITLVEPNPEYTFCPGSNEVFSGHETLENLTFNYDTMKTRYGVNVIQDKAVMIDYDKRQLRLASGEKVGYDKLVVSTGPDFIYDAIEGYSAAHAAGDLPHAWKAGAQTAKLKDQINAMPQGGLLVMSSPDGAYRCPPAPYERMSMIADHLAKVNPTAKMLILDSKNSYTFQDHYEHYWTERYGFGGDNETISWVAERDGGRVVKLDAANKTLITASGEKVKADVINIIPPHKASKFAIDSGLAQGQRWVDFEAKTFKSLVDPNVYVIGDMVNAPMSKTGMIASNQAKVVVESIIADIEGREPGTPFIANNCVAIISEDYGMTIADTHRFAGDTYLVQQRTSAVTDNPYERKIRANLAMNWQRTFRKEIFH
ncbi:NAD(P)/FAD-dependent oxidoreductase [Thiomicrospira microaerophila]|uniref:NAD(P)/FAD-dependent oxidoreductase n=1 Tax=Thiomicrospira microaerophila TaxID=406020 RepID=UPI0005C9C301|nr:FAD/NAD(P)-binding oxidoreductase [Thiomicrospira microaerophila]